MSEYASEPFDPEENNAHTQGSDYDIATPIPVQVFTTGGHDHYFESYGTQETGEQVVRCTKCLLGMEIEPDRKVIDGKILWT